MLQICNFYNHAMYDIYCTMVNFWQQKDVQQCLCAHKSHTVIFELREAGNKNSAIFISIVWEYIWKRGFY